MKTFSETYRNYIDAAQGNYGSGFDIKRIEGLEPLLGFLYQTWWRVSMTGLESLPTSGPLLIVGNTGGVIEWPGLMLLYALMNSPNPRRLNIMGGLDWIEDERIHTALVEIGFVPWSADKVKNLLSQGEAVVMFPEGVPGMVKPIFERYRLRPFDWTKFLPAIDESVPIYPMACLGCDMATPVLAESRKLARFLGLPAFPITPFFPWLPFPTNLLTLPVKWNMKILKPYPASLESGEDREQAAKRLSSFIEGTLQAELNRLIRSRIRPLF